MWLLGTPTGHINDRVHCTYNEPIAGVITFNFGSSGFDPLKSHQIISRYVIHFVQRFIYTFYESAL